MTRFIARGAGASVVIGALFVLGCEAASPGRSTPDPAPEDGSEDAAARGPTDSARPGPTPDSAAGVTAGDTMSPDASIVIRDGLPGKDEANGDASPPRADASSPAADASPVDEGPSALPAPWRAHEIGKVIRPARVSYEDGVFTAVVRTDSGLPGKRQNEDDTILLVSQPLAGDGTITAKVLGWDRMHAWGGCGVIVRSGTEPTALEMAIAAHHTSSNEPVAKTYFRKEVSPSAAFGKSSPPLKLPFWLRVERRGGLVNASYSMDGATFTALGAADLELPARVQIGLVFWNQYYDSTQRIADVRVTTP